MSNEVIIYLRILITLVLEHTCLESCKYFLIPLSSRDFDPKLHSRYTNTLLVVFNNRIFLSNQGLTARGTRSEDLSSYSRNGRGPMPTKSARSTAHTGNPDEFKIQIFKETAVDTDGQMQLGDLVRFICNAVGFLLTSLSRAVGRRGVTIKAQHSEATPKNIYLDRRMFFNYI